MQVFKKKLSLFLTIGDMIKSNFSDKVGMEFNFKWIEEWIEDK